MQHMLELNAFIITILAIGVIATVWIIATEGPEEE